MSAKYLISSWQNDPGGAPAGPILKGMERYSVNPGLERLILASTGSIDPRHVSIGQANPIITFDTKSIKEMLNLVGISAAPIVNDVFYYLALLAGGLVDSESVHTKVTALGGMIHGGELVVRQGQAAILTADAVLFSADGLTSPITILAAQPAPANDDEDVPEVYTLGPVSINGVDLDGVEEWRLRFGITTWNDLKDGFVWPTTGGIVERRPVFTVRADNVDSFLSWDLAGVAQSATDSSFALMDQTAGGIRGSSPITATVTMGHIGANSVESNIRRLSQTEAEIHPAFDGTLALIDWTGLS